MKSFWLATTGLVVAVALSGPANATPLPPINGSDSVIVVSVATNPAEDLLNTWNHGGTITFTDVAWGAGSGNFTNIPSLTAIGDTSLLLSNLGAFSFTSALGSFAGSSSINVGPNTYFSQVTGSTGSAGDHSETLSLYLVGTFTPSGTLASSFAPDNMSVTLALTENGITDQSLGTISASFTVAAPAAAPPPPPPPSNVPEPMSVMMLGAGLFGLGAVRRRRS